MSLNGLMKLQNLDIDAVYSMSVYPRTIIGEKLSRVKFCGRVNARGVRFYGIVAQEYHDKVYSQLPEGTPDDPNQYGWLIFETTQGDTVVVGETWIDADTIVKDSEETTFTFRVKGDNFTPQRVRHALTAIGIYDLEVTGE